MDFTNDFIKFLTVHDLPPQNEAEIIGDDSRRYFQIAGDKEKKGSYCLAIVDGFAYGWAMHLKIGETLKYSSKSDNKFSAEEMQIWKEKREAAKIKQEAELKQLRLQTAEKAKNLWDRAEKTGNSPYLEKKEITLNGAKILNGNIIIPMFIGDKITSIQTIYPNGDKIFMTGGEIKGAYFFLAEDDDDFSTIIISEGFATACAIRKSVDFPVVVAFSAGNLEAVALIIKKKYPNSRIIFGADNDQWSFAGGKKPAGINKDEIVGDDPRWEQWRSKGLLKNAGVDFARQASGKIGGAAVVYPSFPHNHPKKLKDFNDLMLEKGVDAVNKMFELEDNSIPSYILEVPPLDSYEPEVRAVAELYADKKVVNGDWRGKYLKFDKDGKLLKSMGLVNAQVLLEYDDVLSNLFCFNEFTGEKILYRCPPWNRKPETFRVRPIDDADKTNLTVEFTKKGINLPIKTIGQILDSVIKNNSLNPVQEHFKRLVWDGVPRLSSWLQTYCKCTYDDPEYISHIGRKWLIAGVARIFHDCPKFDNMLILEGQPNVGKSFVLEKMATIRGEKYFTDSIMLSELGTTNGVVKSMGTIIVEFPEMIGFDTINPQLIKGKISSTVDKVRLPYMSEPTSIYRQFIMAGTYNPNDRGLFRDVTGNRKFWVARVMGAVDLDGIERDKDQIWAEAYTAYKNGEATNLEAPVLAKAETAAQKRMEISDYENVVMNACYDGHAELQETVWQEDIWKKILDLDHRTSRSRFISDEIHKVMKNLGYTKIRKRNPLRNSEVDNLWEKPNKKEQIIEF